MAAKSASKLDIHIGKRLRALRKEQGMSLLKIGEIAGVTQQQASRLERAENQMSASQLYKFARALNVDVSWFYLGYEEDPAELERVRVAIGEDRSDWSAASSEKLDEALLTAWKALASKEQRERLLAMVEGFALGV